MWTRSEDETFEIEDAEVVRATDRAILVDSPLFDEPQWIPKSGKVIHDDSEVWDDTDDAKGPGSLLIYRWFAEKQDWA
jgi:hypothetical protein